MDKVLDKIVDDHANVSKNHEDSELLKGMEHLLVSLQHEFLADLAV